MITVPTILKVIDNTHVTLVKCLKVLRKRYGEVGTNIIVLLLKVGKHKKLKLGQIHRAMLIRTKVINKRKDGSFYKFTDNAAIMLNADMLPFGHRIKGPIPLVFRKRKYMKMFSKENILV